jgi:hypothetical protein
MIKFENQSNGRYYYLNVETDIFGDNVLSVIRGGNRASGISYPVLAGSLESISQKITEITKTRIRRGYTLES